MIDSEKENTVRVSFYCTAEQLRVIQKAASLMGIPYQSYIKLLAYRMAMGELLAAKNVHSLEENIEHPPEIPLIPEGPK
jgi:uncharacterized protein (DUF1778 family)